MRETSAVRRRRTKFASWSMSSLAWRIADIFSWCAFVIKDIFSCSVEASTTTGLRRTTRQRTRAAGNSAGHVKAVCGQNLLAALSALGQQVRVPENEIVVREDLPFPLFLAGSSGRKGRVAATTCSGSGHLLQHVAGTTTQPRSRSVRPPEWGEAFGVSAYSLASSESAPLESSMARFFSMPMVVSRPISICGRQSPTLALRGRSRCRAAWHANRVSHPACLSHPVLGGALRSMGSECAMAAHLRACATGQKDGDDAALAGEVCGAASARGKGTGLG